MAKKSKKADELSYGQLPFPTGQSRYRSIKVNWCSLNKRQTMNTGDLSYEKNISSKEAPYLAPSERPISVFQGYKSADDDSIIPIGLFGYDDMLCVIYYKYVGKDSKGVFEGTFVDCIEIVYNDDGKINFNKTAKHTVLLKEGTFDGAERCVLKFNKYDTDALIDGKYTRKLVVLPDAVAFDFDFDAVAAVIKNRCGMEYTVADGLKVNIRTYTGTDENPYPPDGSDTSAYWQNTATQDIYVYSEEENSDGAHWKLQAAPNFPPIKYGVVHQSRLFGLSDDKIYVSGYNDYSNWNYDTAMDSSYENAWYSTAQANIKADGKFTGITAFDNHVVCFKRDFMHEVYNNKNPFRVVDICAKGSIDNLSIQEVNGRLIFVSDDEVAVYTGSVPKDIGYKLGINRFANAVSGTDGNCYYLFCTDENSVKHLFVYDTALGEWSERFCDEYIDGFAQAGRGMFMLSHDGSVYRLDTMRHDHDWAFETDFSTGTSYSSETAQSLDINHLSKIQLLADVGEEAKYSVYAIFDDEDFSQFDDNKKSQRLLTSNGNKGLKVIRVYPRITSHYRYKLHFEGHGYVRFYNLEISLRRGGELHE